MLGLRQFLDSNYSAFMDITQSQWSEISPFNRRVVLTLIFAGFFLNLLILVVPIYSLQVFDRVLTSRSMDTLLLISAIVFFLLVIQAAMDILRNRYLYKKSVHLDALLSSHLFALNTIQPQQPTLHDVKELKAFMVSPAFLLPFDLIWTPLFILVLFSLHPLIGALALISICLVGGLAYFIHKRKEKQFAHAQMMESACRAANEQVVHQAESVQSQYLSHGLRQQYQHLTAERIWHELELGHTTSTLTSMAKCLRFTLQMAIMGLGAWLVVNNSMTAGGIIAGSILMSRTLQPLEQLPNSLQVWRNVLDAHQRISAHFAVQPNNTQTTEFSQVKGALHIDGLTWYPEQAKLPLLKNIRLKLECGNSVMVMGDSGSGKSVLCKLLANIYQPHSGDIKIDGARLPQWDSAQLKSVIGYAPQHTSFVAGTIKQNIAHFDPQLDDDKVISAAKKIAIHQDIISLPNGYNTIIGSHNDTIPMGLLKGISVARALYYQPKLLILDEPDAHLDSAKRNAFYHLLPQLKQSHTAVVIVSHNTQLIQHVDWVVQLKNGEITSAHSSEQAAKVYNINQAVAYG
ncbi:type I secretion system permease/ATPase [Vibrio panuliri]